MQDSVVVAIHSYSGVLRIADNITQNLVIDAIDVNSIVIGVPVNHIAEDLIVIAGVNIPYAGKSGSSGP